ncbi:Hypothetical protein D9617_13g101080 [Elsinoe fawcettii]|nr:Hypothetical protein D9617_13g101080 [Elsinoe fawcettii]
MSRTQSGTVGTATPTAGSCRALAPNEGTSIYSTSKTTYDLQCSRVYDGATRDISKQSSYAACIDRCDSFGTGCVALKYETGTVDCIIFSSVTGSTISENADSAVVVARRTSSNSIQPSTTAGSGTTGKGTTSAKATIVTSSNSVGTTAVGTTAVGTTSRSISSGGISSSSTASGVVTSSKTVSSEGASISKTISGGGVTTSKDRKQWVTNAVQDWRSDNFERWVERDCDILKDWVYWAGDVLEDQVYWIEQTIQHKCGNFLDHQGVVEQSISAALIFYIQGDRIYSFELI